MSPITTKMFFVKNWYVKLLIRFERDHITVIFFFSLFYFSVALFASCTQHTSSMKNSLFLYIKLRSIQNQFLVYVIKTLYVKTQVSDSIFLPSSSPKSDLKPIYKHQCVLKKNTLQALQLPMKLFDICKLPILFHVILIFSTKI